MKIGNRYIQFNTMKRPYGISKEAYIKSVKYWRIYAIKQRRYTVEYPDVIDPETGEVLRKARKVKRTSNTILWKSQFNYTFQEILDNPSLLDKTCDASGATFLVAYPRKHRFNPLKNKR